MKTGTILVLLFVGILLFDLCNARHRRRTRGQELMTRARGRRPGRPTSRPRPSPRPRSPPRASPSRPRSPRRRGRAG